MKFQGKRRILTIDDEPNLTDLVKFFLEKTNRYVVFAENHSCRAIAAARTIKPALILLDVRMPPPDGTDIARELGLEPKLSETPILFFTSLISHSEARERGVLERDGQRFLAKPVDPKILIHAVDHVITQTSARQRAPSGFAPLRGGAPNGGPFSIVRR